MPETLRELWRSLNQFMGLMHHVESGTHALDPGGVCGWLELVEAAADACLPWPPGAMLIE